MAPEQPPQVMVTLNLYVWVIVKVGGVVVEMQRCVGGRC
jgi:hypothetical protein